MNNEKDLILSVKDLRVSFKTDDGLVQAVRGVSFDLHRGETLCIVGESGSGKSVTSKAIMGILSGNAIIEGGSIMYEGEDLTKISEEEFHRIRGNKIGMIFQDPLSSLNPIMRIGKQVTEALILSGNHLKRLYQDLISKELIALKNAETAYKLKKELITHEVLQEFKDFRKNNPEVSAKEINAKRTALKASLKKQKSDLAAEYKKNRPALIQNLKQAKKKAKVKVKAYKAKIQQERAESLSALKQENLPFKDYQKRKKEIQKTYIEKIKVTKEQAKAKAISIMHEVGIKDPQRRYRQYPFEFSGGMRQRIVISIALTANPEILICDEPTTALDVTIQAQILDLINDLKRNRNLSCIFITHDLGVVANMADRVAVMYAGKIVEFGKVDEIFYDPRHPYTWALLSSIPDIDSKERLEAIPGTPPNMVNPPIGDAFAARSKYAMAIDFEKEPPLFKITETHSAATWLLHPYAPKVEMPKIVKERILKAKKAKEVKK